MDKKVVASISAASMLVGGMFGAAIKPTPDVNQEVLKQYVYAQVRLNEVPTLNLSVVSADQMSKAIGDLATEKNAKTKDNLFESLHDKALQEGSACK